MRGVKNHLEREDGVSHMALRGNDALSRGGVPSQSEREEFVGRTAPRCRGNCALSRGGVPIKSFKEEFASHMEP